MFSHIVWVMACISFIQKKHVGLSKCPCRRQCWFRPVKHKVPLLDSSIQLHSFSTAFGRMPRRGYCPLHTGLVTWNNTLINYLVRKGKLWKKSTVPWLSCSCSVFLMAFCIWKKKRKKTMTLGDSFSCFALLLSPPQNP